MVTSRYVEVRRILAAEIASGQFEIGERFPTEKELCERFSVSRQTLREALRYLQDAGLLSRRRGAGTTVAARIEPTLYVQEFSTLPALSTSSEESYYEIRSRSRVRVHAPLAESLRCAPDAPWFHFSGLRRDRISGAKFAWVDVFVAEEYDIRDAVGEATDAIFSVLHRTHGLELNRVEQEIRAMAMDERTAKELGVPAGSPALSVLRRYYDESNRLYELAVSVYDGNSFTFRTDLLSRERMQAAPGAGSGGRQ